MTNNTITVNGVDYVRADSIQQAAPKGSKIRIVILQRGWVAIGYYSKKGDMCVLDNAHIIRRWGTSKGLGQLALEGKQADTKLEPTGHVEFHQLTEVANIKCDDSLWKPEL